VELYLLSPKTPSWHGAQLKKAEGQLYLYIFNPKALSFSLVQLKNTFMKSVFQNIILFFLAYKLIFLQLIFVEG
jgi:hypothetical protein